MLTGVGPVGAGAICLKVFEGCGEKRDMDGSEDFLDVGGHFTGQEFGGKDGLGCHCFCHFR